MENISFKSFGYVYEANQIENNFYIYRVSSKYDSFLCVLSFLKHIGKISETDFNTLVKDVILNTNANKVMKPIEKYVESIGFKIELKYNEFKCECCDGGYYDVTIYPMIPDPLVIEYTEKHGRKEGLLFNNRIYFSYINPTQQQKDEYEFNRTWILENIKE